MLGAASTFFIILLFGSTERQPPLLPNRFVQCQNKIATCLSEYSLPFSGTSLHTDYQDSPCESSDSVDLVWTQASTCLTNTAGDPPFLCVHACVNPCASQRGPGIPTFSL